MENPGTGHLIFLLAALADRESWEWVIRASSAFLVMAALFAVYYLFREIMVNITSQAEKVLEKIRTHIYGFVVVFSLWWLLLDLPQFESQVSLVKMAWSVLMFFSAFLIFDLINHGFLGYYSSRVPILKMPQIVINLAKGIYFIIIVLLILRAQYSLDIRPFITGSAILTAIIGLALQDTMGNLFSGLALHLSRPFEIGHWIQFGTMEGMVVKIDWRATTIKTRNEDFVTIPNSQLARVELINFSAPTTVHGNTVEVGVRYEYPPNKIKRLMSEAAMATEGVIKEITPVLHLDQYDNHSINYRMRFFVDDFRKAPVIRSAVMERLWYVFKRNNVEIPFPIRDVYIKEEKKLQDDPGELINLLSRVDFLRNLNREELQDVAVRLKPLLFSKGENIISQGDKGETFYIIHRGAVHLTATNPYGDIFMEKDMKAGDFFGEISLLTGEPRSADITATCDTELLMLDREDFELLLRKYPDMDAKISENIADRQKFTFEQMELSKQTSISEKEAREKARMRVESLSHQLLGKIRNFFSIQ